MTRLNRQWVLARRPSGEPTVDCFRLVDGEWPALAEGEVLIRNHFLSLDPYMRWRMNEARSYAPPQALDQVMQGSTVGEIIESRHPDFRAGDAVHARGGWQQVAKSDGRDLRRIDPSRIPMSAWLGAVGMPGVTAWFGVNRILEPASGETLVVDAASGAVGATVGQLARLKGCRVVGIAGGAAKCRAVVDEFGFDDCIDYKAGNLLEDLARATPNGIDALFENVGGAVFDAVLGRMNPFGRIAVCGLISGYNGESIPLANIRSILVNRLRVQGFIISDHADIWPQALSELADLAASQQLRWRETIAEGLEAAPDAFIGLLKGRNFGKQLVRLI